MQFVVVVVVVAAKAIWISAQVKLTGQIGKKLVLAPIALLLAHRGRRLLNRDKQSAIIASRQVEIG